MYGKHKLWAQGKLYSLQGMACRPNTHRPSFHVNMVGLEKTQRSNSSRFPWELDAEMMDEDEEEFELWLQQALASGLFCETSKRRKSWSPFKLPQKKSKKQWRRTSCWIITWRPCRGWKLKILLPTPRKRSKFHFSHPTLPASEMIGSSCHREKGNYFTRDGRKRLLCWGWKFDGVPCVIAVEVRVLSGLANLGFSGACSSQVSVGIEEHKHKLLLFLVLLMWICLFNQIYVLPSVIQGKVPL